MMGYFSLRVLRGPTRAAVSSSGSVINCRHQIGKFKFFRARTLHLLEETACQSTGEGSPISESTPTGPHLSKTIFHVV